MVTDSSALRKEWDVGSERVWDAHVKQKKATRESARMVLYCTRRKSYGKTEC